MPNDFGTHQRLNSSGLVHASNTMRAGALKVRVTTSSRSDFRSTVVRSSRPSDAFSLLASVSVPRRPCPARRSARPRAGGSSRSTPSLPRAGAGRACRSARARPSRWSTSPACSSTPTCFFMPVRVMWNLSARSVIEASARPSCSSTPRRVASDSAANEASRWAPRILNHMVQCMARPPGRQGPPAGSHFIDVEREPLLGFAFPRRVAQMTDAGTGLISLWKHKEATGDVEGGISYVRVRIGWARQRVGFCSRGLRRTSRGNPHPECVGRCIARAERLHGAERWRALRQAITPP